MSNGKYAKKRHHHRVLDQKKAKRTRCRATDVDQISANIIKATPALVKQLEKRDYDKVGKGEHFCMPCDRYFMNPGDLVRHERSKPHKKRIKYLSEPQYSHAEADKAAGLGSYTTPEAPVYPIHLGLMTTQHKDQVQELQNQLESSTVMN
ncbi:zinc finger protein 593-like [Bolinopsis microptera]|uniref:zinc finger protein 593-like n=1 Tax=Bolinopsis microptera TaxID=2820187 RepID=UPI0030791274